MHARRTLSGPSPRDDAQRDTRRRARIAASALEPSFTTQAPPLRGMQLLNALRARAGGRHVVVLRGYPDPDSLASAWAHVRLAEMLGIDCDIAHMPMLSRAENRAMVNLLGLPLVRLAAPQELERYAAISLVDANAIELPLETGLSFVSVVDHHAIVGRVEADFVDIRPDVGATSTIYTEYLFEGPKAALDTGERSTRLATALAYGIRSDTDDLLRAGAPDLHALGRLVDHVDRDLLAALTRYAIPALSMRILHRALECMQLEGTWAFAGVGHVRPQDRDAIGQAADFLIRREGIKTVITFGVVDGCIDGSLRTYDPSIDPAGWIRDAFGLSPSGAPYGGGRRGKGGFQIPLGPVAACPDTHALWKVVREMIESAIRARIGLSGPDETSVPSTNERASLAEGD